MSVWSSVERHFDVLSYKKGLDVLSLSHSDGYSPESSIRILDAYWLETELNRWVFRNMKLFFRCWKWEKAFIVPVNETSAWLIFCSCFG